MDFFVQAAQWFYGLFQAGGEVFISWTTVSVDADGKVTGLGFVPTVLMLLVAMNALDPAHRPGPDQQVGHEGRR